MVLGTVQFGMDYGIANTSGMPAKKDVFNILSLAWEMGIRRFDTAPGYGSEEILGEFIKANGIADEIKILTKIPPISDMNHYRDHVNQSIENSLQSLTSTKIDVLFFHRPSDSALLITDGEYFDDILKIYPVSTIGVSVYETEEVTALNRSRADLAFQFPYNILDRRFENVEMPKGYRYARSIFLQGLLVSENGLRETAPPELLRIHQHYHRLLNKERIDPVACAITFVAQAECLDYFLFGVDSKEQLNQILNKELLTTQYDNIYNLLNLPLDSEILDPRHWN